MSNAPACGAKPPKPTAMFTNIVHTKFGKNTPKGYMPKLLAFPVSIPFSTGIILYVNYPKYMNAQSITRLFQTFAGVLPALSAATPG